MSDVIIDPKDQLYDDLSYYIKKTRQEPGLSLEEIADILIENLGDNMKFLLKILISGKKGVK